jgi:hypothetical protein
MSGEDILREVDEALRVEKAKRFWEENKTALVVFVAALILGTAAQSAWRSYQQSKAESSTAQFLDALKGQEPLSALQKLSAEKDGSGSALAGLSAASIAVGKKDWDGAITLYQQVADNKHAQQTYRDLAIVQLTSLKIDHDKKASADDLLASISPVVENEKSAWNTRAIFLSAIIKADKQKNFKSAQDDLQILIANPSLPPSFAEQVKALDAVYKIKGESTK